MWLSKRKCAYNGYSKTAQWIIEKVEEKCLRDQKQKRGICSHCVVREHFIAEKDCPLQVGEWGHFER